MGGGKGVGKEGGEKVLEEEAGSAVDDREEAMTTGEGPLLQDRGM